MSIKFRVGQGFDVHVLVKNKPLILGGVQLPHSYGLLGHSDADVLLHALIDAIFGAAGLGDIGNSFPDTDTTYKGADSRHLLKKAADRVYNDGWQIVNVDATVHAQEPRISPYTEAMRTNIAQDLRTSRDSINIKSKTNEGLGFLGRKEGIAAMAVLLIARE